MSMQLITAAGLLSIWPRNGIVSKLAQMLLDAGAHVEAEDAHGNTPLARAVFVSKGRGEMIQLLLARGADGDHANRHGVTPLAMARDRDTDDVARFFDST
jgi:uncharacterized protein